MPWLTDQPPRAEDLNLCVTCGLCLPVCPTFRLTGDETASPRGRLAAISFVSSGHASVDQRFDEVTSLCLQCRACESACPSLVPFGSIMESARAEAAAQIHQPGRRVRKFALTSVLKSPLLLRVATLKAALLQRLGALHVLPVVGEATSGLRTLPVPLPSARGGSWGQAHKDRVVLFTGCLADVWFSDIHRATIELLVAAGFRVDAPETQTCCGALASHSGFDVDATQMARTNMGALDDAPTVVVNVAGCGAHLKEYGRYGQAGADLAGRTVDVTEIVAAAIKNGRLPILAPNGKTVVVQDPCHLEHGQKIVDEPRSILRAAGYEVVDADVGGSCCGAAGVYQIDHRDVSDQLGVAKAEKVKATGTKLVASANAGCEMQLRRFLDAGFEVLHPIEIYARERILA